MRMLSSISLKKKDQFLLPETMETPVRKQEDPGTGAKITSTKPKTKKKFLKSFLVLLWFISRCCYLASGIILTVLLNIFLF